MARIRAVNTGSRPYQVGRPAEYNTFGEYAGRGSLCSHAINRPDWRDGAANMGKVMAEERKSRPIIILLSIGVALLAFIAWIVFNGFLNTLSRCERVEWTSPVFGEVEAAKCQSEELSRMAHPEVGAYPPIGEIE